MIPALKVEAREPAVQGQSKPPNCSVASPSNKRRQKKKKEYQDLNLDFYPPLQRIKSWETTDGDKVTGQGKGTAGNQMG